MDIDKISNLIKEKRKEKKLTQLELANKIGVTEKAISRWETGRGTPDISLLIPLLDVSELLNGVENKKNIDDNINSIIQYEEKRKILKSKVPVIISVILYIFSIILFLIYLRIVYSNNIEESYLFHIVINIILCLLVILSNWNLYINYFDRNVDKDKLKKLTYGILLVIYIIMILNLTIFSRRMQGNFTWIGLYNYLKYGGINIIPFKTIIEYFIEFERFGLRYFFINIFGNIIIFMPIQYLMIKIFGKLSYKKYLLIDFIFIFCIEVIQFLSGCGAFDVDDIILNVFGMSIVYYIIAKKNIKCYHII